MSVWQRLVGLLGGRTRADAATSGEPGPAEPEPSTAERLDDALAGLRERIPEPGPDDPGGAAAGDQPD